VLLADFKKRRVKKSEEEGWSVFMKARNFSMVVLALGWILISSGFGQERPDLLSKTYPLEKLKKIILPAEEWHPFPDSSQHKAWQELPLQVRTAHIERAEKHLNGDWETPKASVFLEYVRSGNRSNYQRVSFSRRAQLAELVLGECIEGKGRFLDDIMNGVWTICEETYWGVPAHVGLQKRGEGLPDVTEPTVGLFAAETGMLLAWTDYLVGDRLDRMSPLIRERIRYEVERRILSVNLERDDFWWMGFDGRVVNNWNPWICSNWLAAVLILEKDPERRALSVQKILRCLDNFLNPYPRDGGCDEGPGYWSRAGGSLYDCLELLFTASKGRIDIFGLPLIKEMGRYICRVYISHPYFINFADAAAKINADSSLIFRYGSSIEDRDMKGFGSFLAKKQNLGRDYIRGSFGTLGRILPLLFHLDELLEAEPKEPLMRDFWLPELQVMGARSSEETAQGLYVAVKGGNNAESHNHNDVGNFIVYADGFPALIDVGVETYTAKTFSSQRYEIWTMQSAFHNLPTINGAMQMNGLEYRAIDVNYSCEKNKATFSLDISKAYPEEAAIKSWKRSIILNRGKDVRVHDQYELGKVTQNLQMTLMSWRKPELEAEGIVRLENPEEIRGLKPVYISYDRDKFRVDIETLSLTDDRLQSSWGENLYRILLTAKKKSLKDKFSIRIFQ
jgi:hypothetical protein